MQSVLERLRAEARRDPGVQAIAVFRRALSELEAGTATDIVAIGWLGIDLDKFIGDFGRWLHEVVPIAQAHERIEQINRGTNGGRGSSTAKSICRALARLDLHEARVIFGNDGDKIRQYPELERAIIHSVVGCRLHHTPYYCHTCMRSGTR